MRYYNQQTKKWYVSGGALKADNGVVLNPTEAVLRSHGYEPYEPPKAEPEPIPAEEQRRQAYVVECDPLLIASLGYEAEGNEEAAAACRAQYLAKKSEIRERIPDEEA